MKPWEPAMLSETENEKQKVKEMDFVQRSAPLAIIPLFQKISSPSSTPSYPERISK